MRWSDPKQLIWTEENVRCFWNWMANNPDFANEYFAKVFGDQIVGIAKNYGLSSSSESLDYGCGPGHLLDKLSSGGFHCVGVEPNSTKPGVISDSRSIESHSFDFAFFIETIEHLSDDHLASALSELRRLLKPNGRILVTTPYRENLGIGKTMCPDCGSVFHRMQHVRSWSEQSLIDAMRSFGFKPIACWGTTLMNTAIETKLVAAYRELKAKLFGGIPLRQHLIYVGERQ